MVDVKDLTPEQRKAALRYYKHWADISFATEGKKNSVDINLFTSGKATAIRVAESSGTDFAGAERVIKELYKRGGEQEPTFYRMDSPLAAMNKIRSMGGDVGGAFWGQHEAHWICAHRYYRDELKEQYPADKSELLELWSELTLYCSWWWPFVGHCFISAKPVEYHAEPFGRENALGLKRWRLHYESGKAIKFPDGAGLYRWHGVTVPKDIIEEPDKITAERIKNEKNQEVRRVMLERFGSERFITESKAELVNADDFGTLYKFDEDMGIVKVINSTPEPDGTRKNYFLRVDMHAYGGLKTAHAAVASTWRKPDGAMVFEKPEDYKPLVET